MNNITRPLTAKQQQFCREYIIDLNAAATTCSPLRKDAAPAVNEGLREWAILDLNPNA